MLSLRLLVYFSLDVLFLSRLPFIHLFIYSFNLKYYYIYETFDVSLCSLLLSKEFLHGDNEMYCIVLNAFKTGNDITAFLSVLTRREK